MKQVTTIKQLRKEFDGIKRIWTQDTGFIAQALMYLVERLEETEPRRRKQKPRKPTEWQKFFAAGMRARKSPEQIAAEWRAKK